MKKTILMGLAALFVTTASSFAAEEASPNNGSRLFQFDFQCAFEDREPVALASSEQPANRPDCFASARLFANVRHNDLSTAEIVSNYKRNLFAVQCEGELIVADPANFWSKEKFVKIEGESNSVSMFVLRKKHDIAPEWMEHRAFLNFGNDKLFGECKVRARPVHHIELE